MAAAAWRAASSPPNGKKATVSGWYADPQKAAELALKISEQVQAEGIYTTLNPCKEALLARADHRLEAFKDRTADEHIERIKNLLIDVDADPGGVSGVSSTDNEHRAALNMAQSIQNDLAREGWPEPLAGDSGNGAHLVYPLDLPKTPENVTLIKDVLAALSLRYQEDLSRENLGVDQAVFNPARLTKLFGTWVRKGDEIEAQGRRHRLAKILSIPEKRQPVPLESLQKLAESIPKEKHQSKSPKDGFEGGRLDVGAYLNHFGIEVVKEKPYQGGTLFCLQTCLFSPEHTGNEAAIFQPAVGPLSYQCFHDSCKGRTWAEARHMISGDVSLAPFMVGGSYQSKTGQEASASPKPNSNKGGQIQIITAAELQRIDFPEPQWVVEGIIPEGSVILAGRPKLGKSWLALDLAVTVATGGTALGKAELRAEPGGVLYLALEDRLRRIKRRLNQIIPDLPFPELLNFCEAWPRLDRGGLDALTDYLKEHTPRLVVIDTLAKVRPPRPRNTDPYEHDVAVGGSIQALAHQHRACLLTVHHTRKNPSDDFLDDVSGTTGITGSADAVLVLKRGRGRVDSTLNISGRDVEEQELALKFHYQEGLWELLGDAAEYAKSEQRQEILEILKDGPRTPKEVADILEKKYSNIKALMWKMDKEGEIKSVEGKYEFIKK